MPATRLCRLLLATALTVTATLTLTACDDGEGLRDEGPSTLSWDLSLKQNPNPDPGLSGASARPPSPSR